MTTRFTLTRLAEQQLEALRGKQKLAVLDFLILVESQGCEALGYRLTGEDPIERICVKHLEGSLRVAVSFESLDHVWILLIGPHDEHNHERDVYTMLYTLMGVDPPSGARTKPACCDDKGEPPLYADAELLADRMRTMRRTRR